MRHPEVFVCLPLALLACFALAAPARAASSTYRTGFARWRAADGGFSGWTLNGVTRTYNRAQLESLWLEHSGGTVYLIYPSGWAIPGLW